MSMVDPGFVERGGGQKIGALVAALRPPVGPGQSPGGTQEAKPPEAFRF